MEIDPSAQGPPVVIKTSVDDDATPPVLPATTPSSPHAIAHPLPNSPGVSSAPGVTPRDTRRTLETRFPASTTFAHRRGDPPTAHSRPRRPLTHHPCRSSGPVASPTRREGRFQRPARCKSTPTTPSTTRSNWFVRVFRVIAIFHLQPHELTLLDFR